MVIDGKILLTAICFRVEKGFSFRLAALLGLSSAIRSNGLINLGFVFYKCMKIIGKGKTILPSTINVMTGIFY